MAIVPEESGEQQPKRCHAREVCEQSKGLHKVGSLRPVCPALKRLLSDWAQRNTLEVRVGTTLEHRLCGVIEAARYLTDCFLTPEAVALWAHQDDLFTRWADLMDEFLPALAVQLQKDYPVSAGRLKELTARLILASRNHRVHQACRGFTYLEPPECALEHWSAFRAWRNETVDLAEIGGGQQARIAFLKITATFPEDVASVAKDIVDELAPIASEVTAHRPQPEKSRTNSEDSKNVFKRSGDSWEVRFRKGERFNVAHVDGMTHIHHLLQKPNREVAAVDLYSLKSLEAPRQGDPVDGQTKADGEYLKACHVKMGELRGLIEKAKTDGDLAAETQHQQELEGLRKEVNKVARPDGKGGYTLRTFTGEAKKKSNNVSKRIRTAIESIDEHDSNLAEYLSKTISTGKQCKYDPDTSIAWDL